jgi:hypothetical protein
LLIPFRCGQCQPLRLFTPLVTVLPQVGNDGAQFGHQSVSRRAVPIPVSTWSVSTVSDRKRCWLALRYLANSALSIFHEPSSRRVAESFPVLIAFEIVPLSNATLVGYYLAQELVDWILSGSP